jgi:hypothetical protein
MYHRHAPVPVTDEGDAVADTDGDAYTDGEADIDGKIDTDVVGVAVATADTEGDAVWGALKPAVGETEADADKEGLDVAETVNDALVDGVTVIMADTEELVVTVEVTTALTDIDAMTTAETDGDADGVEVTTANTDGDVVCSALKPAVGDAEPLVDVEAVNEGVTEAEPGWENDDGVTDGVTESEGISDCEGDGDACAHGGGAHMSTARMRLLQPSATSRRPCGVKARPPGPHMRALVPTPSTKPIEPLPTTDETPPVVVHIAAMLPRDVSTTYKLPDAASTTRPCALLNDALPIAVAAPAEEMAATGELKLMLAYTTKSAPPASIRTATNCTCAKPPASVETARVRTSIVRTRPFAVSATKTVAAPTATLLGARNVAAVPTPFAAPALVPPALPPPANVVTARVESETARMRLLAASATKRRPLVSLTAMPYGDENSAAVPTASRYPAVVLPEAPPPATVVTTPAKMERMTLLRPSLTITCSWKTLMPRGKKKVDEFAGPSEKGLLGVNAHAVDPAIGTPPPANVVMAAPAQEVGDGDGEREALGDGDGDGDGVADELAVVDELGDTDTNGVAEPLTVADSATLRVTLGEAESDAVTLDVTLGVADSVADADVDSVPLTLTDAATLGGTDGDDDAVSDAVGDTVADALGDDDGVPLLLGVALGDGMTDGVTAADPMAVTATLEESGTLGTAELLADANAAIDVVTLGETETEAATLAVELAEAVLVAVVDNNDEELALDESELPAVDDADAVAAELETVDAALVLAMLGDGDMLSDTEAAS